MTRKFGKVVDRVRWKSYWHKRVESCWLVKVEKLLTGNGGRVVDRKRWKGCWWEKMGKLLAGNGRKVVYWKGWKSCSLEKVEKLLTGKD